MVISEITEIKALIAEGERLNGLPGFNNIYQTSESSGLALPIISLVDDWSKRAMRFIYSTFPVITIQSDFPEVLKINDLYAGQRKVIDINYKENISNLINTLRAYECFIEWLDGYDDNDLDVKQGADLCFAELVAICKYLNEELVSSLLGLEDGRTKKTALLHLYGRIIQSIQSVLKLNNAKDGQLLFSALRALLELYIDMLLINANQIENGIEKFFSFSEIYKYSTANKIRKIDKELHEHFSGSGISEYIRNSKKHKQNAVKLWGKQKKTKKPIIPTHWSSLHLEERARRAKILCYYRQVYYYGNMFVHSGYVDLLRTEECAHTICAHVYGLSSKIYKDATELICKEMNITQYEKIISEFNKIYVYGYFQLWKRSFDSDKIS